MGFNRGYRISWSSPMGNFPKEIVVDNTEKWSGDHCVDPDLVPGIFFVNRHVNIQNPKFHDITPTILKIFGIDKPAEMIGSCVI
jgi:bisphosphoglycerate-independent phosphoglycerate mutase (AlkP superfamily)